MESRQQAARQPVKERKGSSDESYLDGAAGKVRGMEESRGWEHTACRASAESLFGPSAMFCDSWAGVRATLERDEVGARGGEGG